jgi:molybdenum cofactor guanylyltransferase
MQPQVDSLLISCNRNLARYKAFGYPLVQDRLDGFQGPLAGIAACLDRIGDEIAVVVPCDCPEPARDLVSRLLHALRSADAQLSYAHDGSRPQYLFTAMRASCRTSLQDYLGSGQRSVRGWHKSLECVEVDFSDRAANFDNINEEE